MESFQTDKGGKSGGTVRAYETELETCTQTMIDTCNSEGSECATCQACPADTNTCYFGTCGMTDGFNVCFGC